MSTNTTTILRDHEEALLAREQRSRNEEHFNRALAAAVEAEGLEFVGSHVPMGYDLPLRFRLAVVMRNHGCCQGHGWLDIGRENFEMCLKTAESARTLGGFIGTTLARNLKRKADPCHQEHAP